MNEELQIQPEEKSLTVQQVVAQVAKIQEVMKAVMKESTKDTDGHYGVIPGTKKPTLFKSGAEKLALTFRMAPTYSGDDKPINSPDGHREYEIKCSLASIHDGRFLGEGVGVCSTKESKWRYRSQSTNRNVPKEYWKSRDPSLLGGDQYHARKSDGGWKIFERIEHSDPADYYNTCKKMAKKRAFVDAVISCLAASDIFTQDVEDLPKVQAEEYPDDTPAPNGTFRETQGAPHPKKTSAKKASSKPANTQKAEPDKQEEQPQSYPDDQPPDDTTTSNPQAVKPPEQITKAQADEIKEALFEGLQHYGENEEGRLKDRRNRIRKMAEKLGAYGYEKVIELHPDAFDEFFRFSVDIAKPTLIPEDQPQETTAEEL